MTPADLAKSGTEHGHQVAVFMWAAQNAARFPCLKWMFAIPNGGSRSRSQGALLKAEGVKPGVADICLPVPRGQYHGLFIEMKRVNGVESDVSPKQREFLLFAQEQGYFVRVAYGWEHAVTMLLHYLLGGA